MEKVESKIVVKTVQRVAFNDERILIEAPGLEMSLRILDPDSHGKIIAGRDLVEQLHEIASDDEQDYHALLNFFSALFDESSEFYKTKSPVIGEGYSPEIQEANDKIANLAKQNEDLQTQYDDLLNKSDQIIKTHLEEKTDLGKKIDQLNKTVETLESEKKSLMEKIGDLSTTKKTK